ncbi:MAG: flagellar hook capping protein [Alphaproteobacteria bacterium]|nr:MAG: flagellar hook capping protein [Alphaproteobacteria bacterium]
MNVNKFGAGILCQEKMIMSDAISSVTQSAGQIQTDYLKLLITQLQNQNPLDPVDNNQMTAQLAQLSQLGQIESLNSKFSEVLSVSQKSYASSLVGKQISFAFTDDGGNVQLSNGTVNGIITQGNDIKIQVGDYTIALSDVLTVI